MVSTPAEPVVTPDTAIDAEEQTAKALSLIHVSLTEIVDAINLSVQRLRILYDSEALKVSGALRAQLIII